MSNACMVTNLENMENLGDPGNLKTCQNLGQSRGI